jgi:hypothetical protein
LSLRDYLSSPDLRRQFKAYVVSVTRHRVECIIQATVSQSLIYSLGTLSQIPARQLLDQLPERRQCLERRHHRAAAAPQPNRDSARRPCQRRAAASRLADATPAVATSRPRTVRSPTAIASHAAATSRMHGSRCSSCTAVAPATHTNRSRTSQGRPARTDCSSTCCSSTTAAACSPPLIRLWLLWLYPSRRGGHSLSRRTRCSPPVRGGNRRSRCLAGTRTPSRNRAMTPT